MQRWIVAGVAGSVLVGLVGFVMLGQPNTGGAVDETTRVKHHVERVMPNKGVPFTSRKHGSDVPDQERVAAIVKSRNGLAKGVPQPLQRRMQRLEKHGITYSALSRPWIGLQDVLATKPREQVAPVLEQLKAAETLRARAIAGSKEGMKLIELESEIVSAIEKLDIAHDRDVRAAIEPVVVSIKKNSATYKKL